MTAVAPAAPALALAERRRSRIIGITLLVLGAAVVVLFARNVDSGLDTTFRLDPSDPGSSLRITLPSGSTAWVIGVVCGVLGGVQLSRGFGKKASLVLAIGIALFVLAYLTWAIRGNSFNTIGMFNSTLLRATPLALGAMAGVLCERSGIVNIAIEGMMLTSAFAGAVTASAADSLYVGVLGGVLAGALLGGALAVLSIRYRMDQIVAGTVLNIFAAGLTAYLSARLFTAYRHLNTAGTFDQWAIPLVEDIPILGPLLFRNNPFVYVMVLMVVILTVALFRTRWGLRTRAVGEHPRAADTVGINVLRVRYRNVILGGAMAGLAGAYLTLGSVGRFEEDMSAGRGFIALAALIVGRWHPVGALGAALVFGFAESLQTTVGLFDPGVPSEFLLMAPYIATLVVVGGFIGRSRPPAADGQPYEKE